MSKERNSFGGALGFVISAAASAVGLGNIWRFPYLAARNGGGLFILIYVILAFTFGISLLVTEIAIGRKVRLSPLPAYGQIRKKSSWMGFLACLVPAIILPYYCQIGGWVIKYFFMFITGKAGVTAQDGYFGDFISGVGEPIIYFLIFLILTMVVVIMGVDKGIERMSKILMPILLVLLLGIAIFSLTLDYTDADGVTRTGLEGFKIFAVPDFENVSIGSVFKIAVDAAQQQFYSLSIAMGIMIAYGSYVKEDVSISKSAIEIAVFDLIVAFLAGVMVVPSVYTYAGYEGMESSGPGLMFIQLPKVFEAMGTTGTVVGIVFFILVLFAALTSSVSMMEAVVSSFIDASEMMAEKNKIKKALSRSKSTVYTAVLLVVLGLICCLGYNVLYFEAPLPGGVKGQMLDLFDFASNSVLMPILSLATCILIGWIVKPEYVLDEVTRDGVKFHWGKLYCIMIKYVVPVFLALLLLRSFGVLK